jgi:hypothetical protein
MPFFIDIVVVGALEFSIDLGRDKRKDAARGEGNEDFVGVVGFVSENASDV